MKIDLHIHTKYSDGGCELQDLFDRLKENNIELISITDHSNFDAYQKLEDINTYNIKIIKGIEMNVEYNSNILHLLLYKYNTNSRKLNDYISKSKSHDILEFKRMINELEETYNIELDEEKVNEFILNNQYFDKVRLNNLLVELNIVNNPKEAFTKYTHSIKDKTRLSISFKEYIAVAKDSNAISIMAHPMKYLKYYHNIENIKKAIKELKELGLDGVEAYNNRQTNEEMFELIDFCTKENLIITAGSDYHNKIGSEEKKKLGYALDVEITDKIITMNLN